MWNNFDDVRRQDAEHLNAHLRLAASSVRFARLLFVLPLASASTARPATPESEKMIRIGKRPARNCHPITIASSSSSPLAIAIAIAIAIVVIIITICHRRHPHRTSPSPWSSPSPSPSIVIVGDVPGNQAGKQRGRWADNQEVTTSVHESISSIE